MILKDFIPHPSLSEFIRCYRIIHFDFASTKQLILKAYSPRPEVCIHFFLKGREFVQLDSDAVRDFKFSVAITGQQTSIINRYLMGSNFLTFNIVFQPTAVYRITGIPLFELTNQYLDAETLFSSEIKMVHEQLQNAESYDQMTHIANQYIASKVKRINKDAHQLDFVSRLMLKSAGNLSLDWVAKESCLSPKQFTRKFYERVGINPKTYLKIIRFSKVVNTRNAYPDRDWLQVAVDCGYFDYQHLVKDYKEFTKLKPNDFHFFESQSPERRLGLADEVYKSRVKLV